MNYRIALRQTRFLDGNRRMIQKITQVERVDDTSKGRQYYEVPASVCCVLADIGGASSDFIWRFSCASEKKVAILYRLSRESDTRWNTCDRASDKIAVASV